LVRFVPNSDIQNRSDIVRKKNNQGRQGGVARGLGGPAALRFVALWGVQNPNH